MKNKLKNRKPIIKNKKEKLISTKEFLYKFRWRILGTILILVVVYFLMTFIANMIPASKYDYYKSYHFDKMDWGNGKKLVNYHIYNWNIFSSSFWTQMWSSTPNYSLMNGGGIS